MSFSDSSGLDQSIVVNRELRKKYSKLIDQERKKKSDDPDLDQSIDRTEQLFQDVNRPREAICDSKLVNIHTEIVKQKTENIPINLMTLNISEFIEKLFHRAGKCKRNLKKPVSSDDVWNYLGTKSKKVINPVPTVHFLYGTYEPGPVVLKKRQTRRRNVDKDDDAIQRPKRILFNENDNEDKNAENRASTILSIFLRLYAQENSPICYFEFVTNPHSFSETIENMFHVSLLIKNNSLFVVADEYGLPALLPFEGEHNTKDYGTTAEGIVSIGVEDWKNIVEKFDITGPLITPQSKKT